MSVVLGPISQLRTRSLLAPVGSLPLDTKVTMGHEEFAEIASWLKNLRLKAKRTLLPCHLMTVRISSDASSTGMGAVYHSPGERQVTARTFDANEQAESSTAREMRGIFFAIESFESYVRGKTSTFAM